MTVQNKVDAKMVNGGFRRTAATPVADLPATLPEANIPETVDAAQVAESFICRLSHLSIDDLTEAAVWRDSLALTGTFRTFNSQSDVFEAWKATTKTHVPADFSLVPGTSRIFRVGQASSWVDARFTFHTTADVPVLSCSGFVSLVPDQVTGEWKLWMLRTVLDNIEGYGDVDSMAPKVNGHTNGESNGAVTNRSVDPAQFDCIVVGGGQAGLGIGGRLQALGVSYLVVDKHDMVGGSWSSRYDSTKLHTAREYGHLPFYRTYDPSYPEFLTKDHVAAGHIDYVRRYGINIWTSTEMVSSSWSDTQQEWTCRLIRGGRELTVKTFHLVFATGAGSQTPLMPIFANREQYQGDVLHSADYTNPAKWKGKRGVVIGAANTAHDIADDMLQAGLSSVTMVQRDRTWVLPAEHYMAVTIPAYNDKIPTHLADQRGFSMPLAVHRRIAMTALHSMAARESERYDALEKVGFNVERYGDIAHIIYERMGGHYMDVGTSAKIAKGLIKIKSGTAPTHYTPNGLAFGDGSEIEADVIVFATGFVGNMREMAGAIVGPDVEDQLEDFWGLDAQGEIRGAFKPCGHPGIWFSGGAIGVARYYGRYIALQIKAQLMGIPLKMYTGQPPQKRGECITNGAHV